MTETIGVLIVFFFILVIGFKFYATFQALSLKERADEVFVQQSIQTAQMVSELPELQCTFGTEEAVVEKGSCIDLIKLQKAQELFMNNNDYYSDIFLFSKISVNVTYPDKSQLADFYSAYNMDAADWPIELYSRIPATGYKAKIPTKYPLLLMDAVTYAPQTKYYFGVLTVEVYQPK